MATVKIASMSAGSATAAMVISRLLPIPPKALAGSSPPNARKNRPRASRPTKASAPPNRLNGAEALTSGTIRPASSVEMNSTYGIGTEYPGSMFGDDHVLAQELRQVQIGLPHARAAAVLQLGLPVLDAAAEEGSQRQKQDSLQDEGERNHAGAEVRSPKSEVRKKSEGRRPNSKSRSPSP